MPGKDGLPESAVPGSPDAVQREQRSDAEATGAPPEVQELINYGNFDLTEAEEERRAALSMAAVGYGGKGWRVVPVWWTVDGQCHCDRREECPNPGKHPVPASDWPHVATADQAEVAYWWRQSPLGQAEDWWPRANVGIVTGWGSGIFVLDVDTYAGGEDTLASYERRHGPMPETRIHHTARGGQHLIFKHPGFDVRNSARRVLGKGLDIRGENGFVVAPPSVGANGSLYTLNPAQDIEPAEAPEWLLDLLRAHDREQTGAAISGAEPTEAPGHARKYAEAALANVAEEMRQAEEGTRNDTLNRCAFTLGTLGGAGLLTEEQAWEALYAAASAAGLTDGEIRGTFLSGWRKGLLDPRQVQWHIMSTDWIPRARTEFGMADRLADHFADQLRFCPERDTWMVYRRGCWTDGTKRAGEQYAQAMIRSLQFTEALAYDDTRVITADGDAPGKSPRDDFIEWVGKQETRKAVSSAAHLATGLQLMQLPQSSFDSDPLMLNVRNGVVNLSTGELMPHSPEQRMTLQCAAEYYPGEPAPKFQMFLQRVQPDPEIRTYLQRVAGYCLTGLTVEQVMFLMQGSGANGKSVWEGLIAHVLGTYAQPVPVETLTASSIDGRIPNDVARMAGRRFLNASETKAGKHLDEQKLKQLTGGDSVTARYMRGEWFDFRMVGKLLLTTNHLPRMSDDAATWRRIHMIPWPVVIPEEERDGYLQDTLIRDEANGVLAWMVEGALAWRDQGLDRPGPLRALLQAWRSDEDEVAQFIADCLEEVPEVRGVVGRDAATIWNVYRAWATREGHPVMLQKNLTERIKKKGYTHYRGGGRSEFPGLQPRFPAAV